MRNTVIYAPALVLACWTLAILLSHTTSGMWVAILTIAVAAQARELIRRYRHRGRRR